MCSVQIDTRKMYLDMSWHINEVLNGITVLIPCGILLFKLYIFTIVPNI